MRFKIYNQNTLLFVFCIFFTVVMFYYPLTSSGFMDIDDSELLLFNHIFNRQLEQGKSYFSSFLSVLNNTEIASFGNFGRFRPLYYFSRVFESCLTLNPFIWFFLQAILFFSAIFLFALSLRDFFSIRFILPIVAVASFLPYSKDLWGRLGPSEIGCFFYLMIFIFAISEINHNKKWAWPLLCISAAFCMAYKENMILLWIPVFFVYAYFRMHIRLKLVWTVFPLVISFFLIILFYKIINGSVVHIYNYETSGRRFSEVLLQFFLSDQGVLLFVLFSIYFILLRLNKASISEFKSYSCFIFVNVLLIILNYVFYNGNIKINSPIRYAFPYSLHYFLIIIAEIRLLLKVNYGRFNTLIPCLVIAVLSVIAVKEANSIRKVYRSHFSYIHNFNEILHSLNNVEEIVLFNFNLPIVAIEPYYALQRFANSEILLSKNTGIMYYPLFYFVPFDNLNRKLELELKSIAQKSKIDLSQKNISIICKNPLVKDQWRIIDFRSSVRNISDIPMVKNVNKNGENEIVLFLLSDKDINSVALYSNNDLIKYDINQNENYDFSDYKVDDYSIKIKADLSHKKNSLIILHIVSPKGKTYSIEKVELK